MNCTEFQRELPDIIENGGSAEQMAHLKSCAVCSDLVKDLKYIADAAKLLVPMEEPSPRVWQGIEKSLKNEGLVRPAGGPERPEPFLMPGAKFLHPFAYGQTFQRFRVTITTAAFVIVIIFALIAYVRSNNNHQKTLVAQSRMDSNPSAAIADQADQMVLNQVSAQHPAMRATYENNMRNVDTYITDAKQSVAEDPDDQNARDQLMNAYEQKDALYGMAMDQATQ